MEHQPFENWILSETPLTSSQEIDLDNHLAICSHCREIKEDILSVENLFRSATFESPSPGFAQRFKLMAVQREEDIRRMQSYFFLGWTLIATVIVSLGYIGTLMLSSSPASVISDIMSSAVSAAYQFDKMIHLLQAWMQVIPLPITLAIIAGSAGLVVLLTSGWVISVWKVSTQGVKANE